MTVNDTRHDHLFCTFFFDRLITVFGSFERNMSDSPESFRTFTSSFLFDTETFQELKRDGKYFDVLLKSTLDGNTREIPCHKLILASASPFFRRELDEQKRHLNFDTIDQLTLEALIEYIYTGGKIHLSPETVYRILDGANKLELKQLQTDSLDFIQASVSVETVTSVLEYAIAHSHEELANTCLTFILQNLERVKPKGFYNLGPKIVRRIVQKCLQDTSSCSTEDILTAVTEWLHTNEDERRKHAFKIIKDIPLRRLDVEFLRKTFREDSFFLNIPEVQEFYVKTVEEALIQLKEQQEGRFHNTTVEEGSSANLPSTVAPSAKQPFHTLFSSVPGCCSKGELPLDVLNSVRSFNSVETETAYAVADDSKGNRPTIRKATVYFVAEHLVATAKNFLWSMDLGTKALHRLGKHHFDTIKHSLIYHNQKIYSFGENSSGEFQGGVFDLKLKKWEGILPIMEKSRTNFCSAMLHDFIYVIGGRSKSLSASRDVERFGLARNHSKKWVQMQSMIYARADFGVGVVDGKIYALAGHGNDKGRQDGENMVDLVECYDPELDKWSVVSQLPAGRIEPGVVGVGNVLYVMGGRERLKSGGKLLTLDTVDVYDTLEDRWSEGVRMNNKRKGFSAVAFKNYVYAIGGDSDDEPTMERFDVENQLWDDMGPIPHGVDYRNLAFCLQE